MEFAKAKIYDTIYDVISYDEYMRNPEFYQENAVAIRGDDGYLYPIRTNPNDTRPGFIDLGPMVCFNPPGPGDGRYYSDRNIIDFSHAGCLREIIEAQNALASAERTILTTVDNLFVPPVNPNDYPEMLLLKEAITKKHIDLSKYEPRFGPNFNNDKRLVRKTSITFDKLKRFCRALDIKASLIMEDAGPDVPNPIGEKLEICITNDTDFESDETATTEEASE